MKKDKGGSTDASVSTVEEVTVSWRSAPLWEKDGLASRRGILVGHSKDSPAIGLTFHVMFITPQVKFLIHALLDSGAEQSLISADLVKQLHLTNKALEETLRVAGITGQNITVISHVVPRLQLFISGNHREFGEFYLFPHHLFLHTSHTTSP